MMAAADSVQGVVEQWQGFVLCVMVERVFGGVVALYFVPQCNWHAPLV